MERTEKTASTSQYYSTFKKAGPQLGQEERNTQRPLGEQRAFYKYYGIRFIISQLKRKRNLVSTRSWQFSCSLDVNPMVNQTAEDLFLFDNFSYLLSFFRRDIIT